MIQTEQKVRNDSRAFGEIMAKARSSTLGHHTAQTLNILVEVICYLVVIGLVVLAVLLNERMLVGADINSPYVDHATLDRTLSFARILLVLLCLFPLILALLVRTLRKRNRALREIFLIASDQAEKTTG